MDVDLRAVAVDLDLMQPSRTVGGAITQGRIARLDESGEWRALRARNAGGRLAVTGTSQRDGTHADLIGLGPSEFHDRTNCELGLGLEQEPLGIG
jgi:hypothetical protein